MPDGQLTPEEMKEAVADGIERWMDKKFTQIGKWSARAIIISALGALGYFILHANGWHK